MKLIIRRGFSFSVMAKMSELSRKPWAQLDDYDKQLLTRRGVGEADWLVLNATKPEAFKGLEMLTPQAVRDAGGTGQLVSRIVGLVADEAEFAVLNPDLYTKALSSWGGTARGTPVGELSRSVMQFKSFPIAMMSRHWGRLMDAPSSSQGAPLAANKLAYGSAMFVSLTVLGAIAFQLKQMLQGKDPIALDDPKFWARAVAQGGGLSIAGDLLLTDPTDNPGDSTANMIKTLAGPVVGSVGELSAKTIENVYEYAKGKDTHAGAEYVNWLKSHTPYVGLWYTRAVFEHAVLNDINEAVSPGYLSKVEARGRKTFKQDYWWRPGEDTPSRGPDLSKLVD